MLVLQQAKENNRALLQHKNKNEEEMTVLWVGETTFAQVMQFRNRHDSLTSVWDCTCSFAYYF